MVEQENLAASLVLLLFSPEAAVQVLGRTVVLVAAVEVAMGVTSKQVSQEQSTQARVAEALIKLL